MPIRSAPMPSSLRTVTTTMRRPRGQSLSISNNYLSKNFHRVTNNFLAFNGPAQTNKRFYSHNMDPFKAPKLLRRGRSSPASSLAPYLQSLPHNSNRLSINDEPSSLVSRTNKIHPKEATYSRSRFNACLPHFPSLLPSNSFLAHEPQHRFRILLQTSSPPRTFSIASMGTTRAFSTTTALSMNRFPAAPQMMIRYKAGLPSARNVWLRNASSSKDKKPGNEPFPQSSKSKDSSPDNKIQEFMDSTVSTVRTNVGSAEAKFKRAVEELSTGDLLSVYGIVLFIAAIAFGPSLIRRMRSSDGTQFDPEDPVMDLARMIRSEYLESIKRNMIHEEEDDDENEEETEENKEKTRGRTALGLDRIVADLLKSPQIQQAATNLVTSILQSAQFKTACQLLLKELLKDLLDDPDTLKQVIHLLQNAIKDEKIKEAAVQLATDIFGDDRVLDELVTLVQRLGMEQQVKYATQALLVESAHNALNDPEILDHSMEFATDVVGDDVVQQTAGEALYNTMSYAFRPTLSVLLTLTGIGLIFVSIAAFRNINQTPSDAADRAFFDTVEEVASRLMRIVLLPIDFLVACKDALISLVLFPFRLVSSTISKASKLGQTLLGAARDWIAWLLYLPAQLLSSLLHRSEVALRKTYTRFSDRFIGLLVLLDESILGVWFHKTEQLIAGSIHRVQFRWTILNHEFSDRILMVQHFGVDIAQKVSEVVTVPVQRIKFRWMVLNRQLSETILSVQCFGDRMVQGTVARKEQISQLLTAIPVQRIKSRWVVLNRNVSENILLVQNFGERTVQTVYTTYEKVVDRYTKEQARVAKLSNAIASSRQYHSLNRTVAACAIVLEDWIRNTSGINLR